MLLNWAPGSDVGAGHRETPAGLHPVGSHAGSVRRRLPVRAREETGEELSKPQFSSMIQGETSRCAKSQFDFKTKVALWPGLARPKRNFCFDVNGRFCTT